MLNRVYSSEIGRHSSEVERHSSEIGRHSSETHSSEFRSSVIGMHSSDFHSSEIRIRQHYIHNLPKIWWIVEFVVISYIDCMFWGTRYNINSGILSSCYRICFISRAEFYNIYLNARCPSCPPILYLPATTFSDLGTVQHKLGEPKTDMRHHPATMLTHKTQDKKYGTRLVPIIYATLLPQLLTSEPLRFADSYSTYLHLVPNMPTMHTTVHTEYDREEVTIGITLQHWILSTPT